MSGDMIYVTPNWAPDPMEIKKVVNAWRGQNSISVTLQGVKFSVLQAVAERFISTNIKKQGHLVGATTPMGECVLGFVLPDGAYDGAYMDVSRAAGQMRPGGSAAAMGVTAATAQTVYQKTDVSQAQLEHSQSFGGGGGSPDAQEVQQLLQWVMDSAGGMAYHIQYAMNNYDQARIAAFARFYRTLRQLLG